MGLHKNQELENRDKRRQKVATKKAKRLARFKDTSSGRQADWSTCSAALLQDVVVLITDMGGAVIFGMSRDMGALNVTLMVDKEREAIYFDGSADVDEELQVIILNLRE